MTVAPVTLKMITNNPTQKANRGFSRKCWDQNTRPAAGPSSLAKTASTIYFPALVGTAPTSQDSGAIAEHGKAAGTLWEKSPHEDILDIIDDLPKGIEEIAFGRRFRLSPDQIFVIGGSFGGAAATYYPSIHG
jgi:hypothetical protein